jgi:hypothetical protein
VSIGRQVVPVTDTETTPSFLWFATIQDIKSKQDLADLAPRDCFISAKSWMTENACHGAFVASKPKLSNRFAPYGVK